MTRSVELTNRRPRRWGRRLAIGFVIVVLILLAAIWQLPWLLGTAPGRAFIASKLSTDSMRFSIDSLDFAWSGEQAVSGVRLRDAQGREVADVSAAFKGSLWSWATGSRDFGAVVASGNLTVYESPATGAAKGGGETPSIGKPGGAADFIIPEGVKASLQLDTVTVRYVPLPNSTQPAMAVRDVKGAFTIDGRSPVTLNLVGKTEVGSTAGSFAVDASIADFAAGDGLLQPDKARLTAKVQGENLPIPIIEQMIGERGRLSAALGESMNLSISAAGGTNGGEVTLIAESPRSSATLIATVDAQRRLNVTQGQATLTLNQRTLEAILSVEQLAGLSLSQQTTVRLHIQTLTAQLPTTDQPFDLSRATVDATLAIDAVSINTGRDDVSAADLQNLEVHVASDDPTQKITLQSNAQVTSHLPGEAPPVAAPLNADVTFLRAFEADGSWSGETLGLAGLVRTENVPSSFIDSLAGADGWVVDAVGPMLTRVELTAGADAATGDVTMLGLTASSLEAQASANLRLADGRIESIKDKPVEMSIKVRPALRDRLAAMVGESSPQVRLDEGGQATVRLTSLNVALPNEGQADSWKHASMQGSIVLQQARATYTATAAEGESPIAPKRFDVDHLAIDFRADSLSKLVSADIRTTVKQDGIPYSINGKAEVGQAFDAPTRIVTFAMEDTTVPLEIINAWAGDQKAMVTEALGGPVRLSLNASQFAAGLSANAKVRSERSDVQLTYAMQNDRTLFELRGTQRATPGLVAALLGPDPAVVLAEPADLALTLATPTQAASGAAFNDWPLKLDASTSHAVVTGLKGIPGSITTTNVKLNADWGDGLAGVGKYVLTGQVSDGQASIAQVNSELHYTIGGDWTRARGRLTASDVNVTAIERTLALEPGLLTAWLGGKGGLEVGSVIGSSGELTDDLLVSAKFDQASAHIAGRLVDDRLVVNTPGTLTAHLDRTRLASLLNKWTGAASSPSPATQWTATEDSDVSATVRRISLPLAVLSGGEYDPRQMSIDADVTVPRLALRQGATGMSLADTLLKIGGTSLAEGLTAQLKSTTTTGAAAAAGGIDLNGSVRAATSRPEDRRYNVSGTMKGVPVAIFDAMTKFDGRLVAALGPSMDMQLTVADAYANGGTVAASITTPNGALNVPRADLRDSTLVIESASPLSASLEVTPEMSTTLLANVNPLLYDVQKKSGPILLNASRLVLPLDGDISKLGGQFTLDLGQLYVPTQGILGEFLGQLKPKTDAVETDRVETLIPPITARIHQGVLEYDKFIMQSQAFEITTSGKVDLVKRRLDLLASVPLIGWKSVFADLTKIAPPLLTDVPLNVPFYLVVRGPIDKPEIKPDPKGAQRVADEFFKNFGGNLIDNALENIFKPRR